jgi:exosortase
MSTAPEADQLEENFSFSQVYDFIVTRPYSVAMILAVVCLLLSLFPHALEYFNYIYNNDHFGYALFVPFGAAFLIYARGADLSVQGKSEGVLGVICFVLASLSLFASLILETIPAWILSFVIALLGMILVYGGKKLFYQVWSGWLFLLLMVPLPYSLDQKVTQKLQFFSSQKSSLFLDRFLNVPHILRGNTILIEDQELFVEEACSGINSLFATAAVLFFVVLYTRRAWLHSLLLFFLGFLGVLAVNVFRITSLTVFHAKWPSVGEFFDEGIPHTMFGLGCFAILLIILYSADSFLHVIKDILVRILPKSVSVTVAKSLFLADELELDEKSRTPEKLKDETAVDPSAGNSFAWYGAVVLFGGFAVLQWVGPVRSLVSEKPAFYGETLGATSPGVENLETILPANSGSFQLVSFESNDEPNASLSQAYYSTSWNFINPSNGAKSHVYFHRPYPNWHRLEVCYQGTGWRVSNLSEGYETIKMPLNDATDVTHVTFDLELPSTSARYVFVYTMFDYKNRTFLIPKVPYLEYLTNPTELARRSKQRIQQIVSPFGSRSFNHDTAGFAIMLEVKPGEEMDAARKVALQKLHEVLQRITGPIAVR